jgi:hypothetical protein
MSGHLGTGTCEDNGTSGLKALGYGLGPVIPIRQHDGKSAMAAGINAPAHGCGVAGTTMAMACVTAMMVIVTATA